MEVWVISDHEDLASRIRQLLERPEQGSIYARTAKVAGCLRAGLSSAKAEDVVFYAAPELTTSDFEALRHLRAMCRATLTVIAPMTDNAIVLRAIRAGAEDFLDATGDLGEETSAFLAKARAGKSTQVAKGRLVAVLSAYMPTDASILATNLATVIAKQIGSCALLDFHRHGGDLALLLKLAPRHTLRDLVSQEQGIDQVMFEQALSHHDSGVHLLANSHSHTNDVPLQTDSHQEFVAMAQSSNPFVVVTSDDGQHLSQLVPLSHCDHLLFAMRLDLLSLHRAQKHIELLRSNQIAPDRLEIVAMDCGQPGELPAAAVAKSLGVPRIHLIPQDAIATTVSINLGQPMVLGAPHSAASLAIRRLAAVVTGSSSNEASTAQSGRFAAARAATVGAVSAMVGYFK